MVLNYKVFNKMYGDLLLMANKHRWLGEFRAKLAK